MASPSLEAASIATGMVNNLSNSTVVIFPGVFLLILILAPLAAIPQTNKMIASHKPIVFSIVLVYLAILFLHPYIFGLAGRIGELRFQRQIHAGMTAPEIARLANRFGGTDATGSELYTGPVTSYDWQSDNALDVQFIDYETFCISGGKLYTFYFLPNLKLTQWESNAWSNAC